MDLHFKIDICTYRPSYGNTPRAPPIGVRKYLHARACFHGSATPISKPPPPTPRSRRSVTTLRSRGRIPAMRSRLISSLTWDSKTTLGCLSHPKDGPRIRRALWSISSGPITARTLAPGQSVVGRSARTWQALNANRVQLVATTLGVDGKTKSRQTVALGPKSTSITPQKTSWLISRTPLARHR